MTTRDEILNMPAGREMDALVADRVMGLHMYKPSDAACKLIGIPYGTSLWKVGNGDNDHGLFLSGLPNYSTDIAAALEVVGKATGFQLEFDYPESYFVSIWLMGHFRLPWPRAFAETAPLAICRAALLAVLEDE